MRRGTSSRKATRQDESEAGNIDESWGEIKSHIQHGKQRTPRPTRLDSDIRCRKRERCGRIHLSSRKRTSIHTGKSSRASASSQRRATDIFRTAKSRYRNIHSRDLPSGLRQKLPRSTDPPMSAKYGPATIPKTKQKDDMCRVSDVLLTMRGGKWETWKPTTSNWRGGRYFPYGASRSSKCGGEWGLKERI